MRVVKGSKILSDLRKDGWYIVHQKGSHRKFRHSIKKGIVTVNGSPSTDFYGDLLKSIENQFGLVF
jgi:predicted RNA binding protein YcfA (HicA-like mRNA interferase family)